MPKKASQPQPRNELLEAAREVIAEADVLLSSKRPPTDRFRAAVEKLRALVPGSTPAPEEQTKPGGPRTQEEWDAHVLEWALRHETPITLERAFTALAPGAAMGSPEHAAIAAGLNKLPRSQFTVSWYMANTALAPVWTRHAK